MDSLVQSLQASPMSFFLIAITSLFFLGLLSRLRRRLPYPPGPKGLPLVGSMHMMDQITHRGLAKLAKQYGGLFHMRMGYLHMVTVSSPEIARQVLQVQDNIFSNRPANIAIRYLTYDRADMAFAHYGPFWRQMRKLCVMKLFSRKRAESWESVRDEVDSMLKTVEANIGKPVNLGELIFTLTMNITYRAAFGAKNEGQDEFIKILQEFSKLFGAFNMSDFIPWLGWIDPQGLSARLVKARKALDKFIDSIIDDHIQKRKQNNFSEDAETDMVDDMLAFYSEEARKVDESDDLQKAISLTKDNIKAIIMVSTDALFLQYPIISQNNILYIN
jgi:ferulate-5-hydroxylase